MDSTPEATSEKQERSYLSAAVESISPWASPRSSTPKSISAASGDISGLKNQHGGDYTTQHSYGLSLKRYPLDCPPLNARWFYAIDVPKRKPKLLNTGPTTDTKPKPVPKKFVTFSEHDSRAIEAVYQQLADENYDTSKDNPNANHTEQPSLTAGRKLNTSLNEPGLEEQADRKFRVPVQEDYLFDVDIERRELSPVYWLGPIYEVRRGSWFYQEGTTLRPCEENLAAQLEEGYLKIKPFRYPKVKDSILNPSKTTTSTRTGEGPGALAISGAFSRSRSGSSEVTPKPSMEELRATNRESPEATAPPSHQPQTYRLFGIHMNSVVTYQDTKIAWLLADSIMSRVSSTVYQKFAGGGYLGGLKLVRGYSDPQKPKEAIDSRGPSAALNVPTKSPDILTTIGHASLQLDERQQKLLKRRSAPPITSRTESRGTQGSPKIALLSSAQGGVPEQADAEAVRTQDEKEIRNEWEDEGGNQGRQIDHLILCTHGIGQRLGMRTESVNFVHDVNVLRQSLKNVYESSADLQALNSEIENLPKNCRVQVLPICWRHLLDFPKKGVRQIRKEHDLGDAFGDEEEYPSLEDITIEGAPFVRSLITDLALDILLFQSAYKEHICNIVLAESNRIYDLFKVRNPDFKGKVSLVGHSLGSAILFELLSRQKEYDNESSSQKTHQSKQKQSFTKTQSKELNFHFEVEDFYCLGSPIGLFQMLKGRNISARHLSKDFHATDSQIDSMCMQDPFLAAAPGSGFTARHNISNVAHLPPTLSSPKVGRLYNIFHPSDPIAYRLEPLISPAMSSMKPQLLPYTKKSISSSMSGIGAKVGQSVSGIWTSLSSGLASSLLNRSLGLTQDDVARMEAPNPPRQAPQPTGVGTSISGGVVSEISNLQREHTAEKKRKLAENTAAADREGTEILTAATLIDDEMETLYSGFQKARNNNPNSFETDERGKKLKLEEAKIRALNPNGRVDYSIQEAFLDLNPMNTIASHLSYWADEDVSHFLMSQLLSRHRNSTREKAAHGQK